jgi:hypothetical protein
MGAHTTHIFVLADDLTGAAEIGGIAFQYGLSARILLGQKPKKTFPEDLIIIDTASRGFNSEKANQVIRGMISGLDLSGFDLVYKKTDSLLRGEVVAEIRALLAELEFDRVLLIPANPSRNRIIKDARLFIGGKPVHKTGFRMDPVHPRLSDKVSELLGDERVVVTGNDPVVLKAGKIFVPNIGSEEDITDQLSKLSPTGVLPAGGSDLFRTILSRNLLLEPVHDPALPVKPGSHHFIAGSNSESSMHTANKVRTMGYDLFELPGKAIREEAYFMEWTGKIRDTIKKGGKLMVKGPSEIMDDPDSARGIIKKLALAAKVVAEHSMPGTHLFMEGGETASAFFRTMGWDELLVRQVHDVGVVTLQAVNDDLPVTVKPGSYAWPEYMLK